MASFKVLTVLVRDDEELKRDLDEEFRDCASVQVTFVGFFSTSAADMVNGVSWMKYTIIGVNPE